MINRAVCLATILLFFFQIGTTPNDFVQWIFQGRQLTTDALIEWGALYPPMKQLWRLLSSPFLHLNALHLFSNVVFLYFIGNSPYCTMVVWSSSILSGEMMSANVLPCNIVIGISAGNFGLIALQILYIYRNFNDSALPIIKISFYILLTLLLIITSALNPKSSHVAHAVGFVNGAVTSTVFLQFHKVVKIVASVYMIAFFITNITLMALLSFEKCH